MSNSQTEQEAYQAAVRELAIDPLRFVAMCWPEMRLYSKQREVLLSLRDNIETFVHAANETGKTRIAAIIVLWFFATRTPARVITSSSSETQLASILWTEIHSLLQSSRYPLPFLPKMLCLKKLRRPDSMDTEPSDYVIGHVTNVVENFQGHHLPNDRPRVLAVFDEASGVPDEFYEAARSWAHRILVIGNPLSTTNFFYRCCRAGDVPDPAGEDQLLRKVIHIDGRDSPNVEMGLRWREAGNPGRAPLLIPGLLGYDDYLRREQELDEVQRMIRLYGQFYEGDRAVLYPTAWLDAAMDAARWTQLQNGPRKAEAMGVDVAAGGRDNTCWTVIDGQGVIEQIVADTPNTMEIPGRTIQLMRQYNLGARRVAIDAGGGGKQIADRLREQRYPVRAIGFGESAEDKQGYRNRRAEMYAKLRTLLNPNRDRGIFALPPNSMDLRQELAVLPLQFDSEGRMQLPPKEASGSGMHEGPSIRRLLGRSPDRADSLVLAVLVLCRPRRRIPTIDRPLVYESDPGVKLPTDKELEGFPEQLHSVFRFYRDQHDDLWGD